MANFLRQVVWLLPFAVGLATAAPFSHRIHLQQKLACAVCHAAATSSTKAADNLLPNPALCAGCHKDGKQVKSFRAVQVAFFNHRLHSRLPNIGSTIAKAIDSGAYLGKKSDVHRPDLDTSSACLACHRGIDRSEEVSHALFPKMADCLVCHSKVDPPFSCEKCHLPGDALKPATHTSDWLERHSSAKVPKDKESCAVCHGRQFTCLGCH